MAGNAAISSRPSQPTIRLLECGTRGRSAVRQSRRSPAVETIIVNAGLAPPAAPCRLALRDDATTLFFMFTSQLLIVTTLLWPPEISPNAIDHDTNDTFVQQFDSVELISTDTAIEIQAYDRRGTVIGVVSLFFLPGGELYLSAEFDDGYSDVVVADDGAVDIRSSLRDGVAAERANVITEVNDPDQPGAVSAACWCWLRSVLATARCGSGLAGLGRSWRHVSAFRWSCPTIGPTKNAEHAPT